MHGQWSGAEEEGVLGEFLIAVIVFLIHVTPLGHHVTFSSSSSHLYGAFSGKKPSVCGFEASPSASKRAPLSPLDSLVSNYPEDVSHDDHLIAMVTPASSPMCIRNGGREAVGIIIRAALYVRVRVRACAIASDECLEMRSCGF